ncbi:MAG: tryptophan synthase subunit alpha [Thermogemmatispora sp.]|jgi:tryptophan synthase alpha chain|uniref:Tryptophan synthase alpha chain n=1 Tax=Thermogemmatispora aurantia TaxID=2045279 RepID=A0A5J4KAF3_9CHLR|nr:MULTISPECIES: tryptophan synthase subunit alpha [Thermogemmatispora]MBE3565246.1 tryptophan synthase subunit alpha [Thermogemmatispora sp.]GER83116.1 tryptophan synthase alpha chain [Thermogemmatispora aurantia]
MQQYKQSEAIERRETVPAQRIGRAFAQASREGRCVLIPYLMCGFPSVEQSLAAMLAAIEGGADLIELGLPFSDPLADGATIQHASHQALEHGINIAACLAIAHQVAARSSVPLILMGYYNPVLAYGVQRFCREAAAAGACGLIIPDLPPEEAGPLLEAAHEQGLAMIFLVPPTTPDERIASIVRVAAQEPRGFIYCVSLSGVTGARDRLPPHLQSFIARVRRQSAPYGLPLAVGFGVSRPEHVAEIARYADGAVVGSALVHLLERHAADGEAQRAAVRDYIRSLRECTVRLP